MDVVRHIDPQTARDLPDKEWLVANGLGGYACGTLTGALTRRYHGLLIAALPAPLGRTMMLHHLGETVVLPGGTYFTLNGEDGEAGALVDFRLEWGLPMWRYEAHGAVVEKRVVMPHQQNTAFATWRLVSGPGPVEMEIRPWTQFRGHDDTLDRCAEGVPVVTADQGRFEIALAGYPPLRLKLDGDEARFALDEGESIEGFYRIEADRGYPSRARLWSPGVLRARLCTQPVTLLASAEPWHVALALTADEARAFELERRRRLVSLANPELRHGAAAELVLAADSFLVVPRTRVRDQTRARSQGEDVRTVIAGYHWFADWGRDTMISLPGLTLVTGRPDEARWILSTFAHYVRDGLIPNDFPDRSLDGKYNTADATLWFFHAIDKYLEATGDRRMLHRLLPVLTSILDHHRAGTHYNIGVDPADGLLRQGAEGLQLTWMDAKVEDWVVTPRRGKAVELNALWYNALRLMEGWLRDTGDDGRAAQAAADAERVRRSFNQRFWNPAAGWLFDVVDGEDGGDDPSCRPNQIFAVSLAHPVLDADRWEAVVETVRSKLLTPLGLRSLDPGHPDYKPRYFGNLRARDAAYHQGTVWAWLIGHYVDAWLRLHPADGHAEARRLLEGLIPHLDDVGVGSIAEVFDADPPFVPRGCISQAWSVAEWLRAWVRSAPTA